MSSTAILYDEDCGFCRWSIRKVLAWDRHGRLRPVALQDPEGERRLGELASEDRMGSWHLVTPDGRMYSAGAAVSPLLRLLPGGRPLAAVADAFPKTTERAYRWVARHRERLGRSLGTQACAIHPASHGTAGD